MLSFGSSAPSPSRPSKEVRVAQPIQAARPTSKEPRSAQTTARRDPPPPERPVHKGVAPEKEVQSNTSAATQVKPKAARTQSSWDQATRFMGKANLQTSSNEDSRSVASSASSSSSVSSAEPIQAVHSVRKHETTISEFLAQATKQPEKKQHVTRTPESKPATQTLEAKSASRSNRVLSGYEKFNTKRGNLQTNLKDAAVVMNDKKSSVISSSSSASSSLSHDELGGIARTALKLSKIAPKKQVPTISKFLAKEVKSEKKTEKKPALAESEPRAGPFSGARLSRRINTTPVVETKAPSPNAKNRTSTYAYGSATRLSNQLSRGQSSPTKASPALSGPLTRSLSPEKRRLRDESTRTPGSAAPTPTSTTPLQSLHVSLGTPKGQKKDRPEAKMAHLEPDSPVDKRTRHLNSIAKTKANNIFERQQETTFGIRESTKQNQPSTSGMKSFPAAHRLALDSEKIAPSPSETNRDTDFVIRPYYSPRRRVVDSKKETAKNPADASANCQERQTPANDSRPEQENDEPKVTNPGRQLVTPVKHSFGTANQVNSGVQNRVKAFEGKRSLQGTRVVTHQPVVKQKNRDEVTADRVGRTARKRRVEDAQTSTLHQEASPERQQRDDGLEFLSHLKGYQRDSRRSSDANIRSVRPSSTPRDPGGVYGTDDVSSIVHLAEPPGSFGERCKSPSLVGTSFRRTSRDSDQRSSPYHQTSQGSEQQWGSPRNGSSPSFVQGHPRVNVSPAKKIDRRGVGFASSRDHHLGIAAHSVDAPTGNSPTHRFATTTPSPTSAAGLSGTGSGKKEVVDENGVQNAHLFKGGENHSRSSANGASRAGGCTESSDSRPDAFQWLHQKYGNKTPTANVDAIEKAKTQKQTQPHFQPKTNSPLQPSSARVEDDEDIFFGLDDESLPDTPPELPNNIVCEKKPEERQRRQPASENVLDVEKQRGKRIAEDPSVQQRAEVPQQQDPPFEEKGNIRTLQETIFANTVISDLTTSLMTDRAKRSQFFMHNDSIMKTPKTAASDPYTHSVVYEQVSDESTYQDQPCQKPPSVFNDISAVIAQSLKDGTCAVPNNITDKIKDVPACAMTAKAQCAAKIDEAMDAMGRDQDSTGPYPYSAEGVGRSGTDTTATTSVLNDVEMRIWQAWDRRRSRPSETPAKPPLYENDLLPEMEQSSSSTDSETKAKHYGLRQEAHDALMEHAQKAVAIFGMNSVPSAGASTSDGSSSEMPKPRALEQSPYRNTHSPSSRLSSILSFREQEMLENFSSALKNTGIEVLKLGRRNIWQIRYLTVSKEVTQLPSGNDSGEIGQCPKALLWPKTFKPQYCSVATIKENGRGGVLFEHLKRIRPCSSNEHYDNHLPKKLKQMFPVFAGVVLDYAHDGGDRQLQLCFKSEPEAHAFITAMLIIREANDRRTPCKDEGSAYTTHSNSDSLLD